MRYRRGKGQTFALDAEMQTHVEKFRRENGFYPSLRETGETFSPPLTISVVVCSLRRLSAAGKLSADADLIYNSKKGEKAHGETGQSRKSKKAVGKNAVG